MPMIMYTFFDEYDLSGKTIVPFNTHEGSEDSGTYSDIADLNSSTFEDFDLPPTYYVYGTEDPFYSQFNSQVDLLNSLDKNIESLVLDNYPHGFGASGGWVDDVDNWLMSL